MLKHLAFACIVFALACIAACTPAPQVAAPVAAPPPPTFATGFVCEDGNTPVQNTVCGSRQLAALDVQLAAAYRTLLGGDSLFVRDQVLATQRAWLLGLQSSCNVPNGPGAVPCLAAAYQAQIAKLTSWPPPQTSPPPGPPAITHYVTYKPLDVKQPALCDALNAQAATAMDADGIIDPSQLTGAREIAGSHGNASGTLPQGGTATVDLYRAGLYGNYQIRARALTLTSAAAPLIDANSVGSYVETLPNGGGRFVSAASQTSDYGAIDVFTLGGQVVALVTDVIGSDSPAPPGEAAVAALYTISPATAAPACLFETFLMPPPISISTIADQPSLGPFLAVLADIAPTPSVQLAPSDRQDTAYFESDTKWLLFNMPRLVLQQEQSGDWTGWLRSRHDEVLDALYAWSQQSAANQAAFTKLFALLVPAAQDLDTVYVQQQGLATADAEQATAIAMMELLYQATINIAPGLGAGPADPADFRTYKPRYAILTSPRS